MRLTRTGLKTPKAAAIAGIVFSVMMVASLVLLRTSLPSEPLEAGAWLRNSAGRVTFALNLVPFSGVAFMWFLGVMRDRLGGQEDRFFATVFLGSGLTFLGMFFVAASAVGALVLGYAGAPESVFPGATFTYGRAFAYTIMHVYAFKMAAVFMVAASTLILRTGIAARWIAWFGYVAAVLILVTSGYIDWPLFVFPAWVFTVSVNILAENLRPRRRPETSGT
ncbi:MAG: hypothetical protein JSR21_05255 [Proteobacteria bacterium]|nr:hypothetical protein [Pseudomonadota bacterium]